MYQENTTQKKTGVVMLIANKIGYKAKKLPREEKVQFARKLY